ncbi:fungal-specific transcription factor domain-containing protein [Scleroderma yunnanense]
MPPSPKSPQTKRPGAPKAKGAVRAKSGCYTCRIRRKKCDERMNTEGSCETCVRLRLQCLGFGAKRPDWLRESRNVTDLREKIKSFLASQGMIKGHSGSGPRSSEQEPQILHLSNDYVSPSTSPQTPTLSITSSHDERIPSTYPPGIRAPFDTDRLPVMQENPDSPGYDSVILPHPFTSPSVSLDQSWTSHHSTLSHHHHHHHALHLPRPHTSDFSRWYSHTVPGPIDDDQASDVSSAYLLLPSVPSRPWNFSLDTRQNNALNYYMDNVLRMQYLHADGSLDAIVWNLIHSSESAREAACLLSELHRKTREYGRPGVLIPADMVGLHRLLPTNSVLNEDEAFAGLCVVSYFLLSGGKGQWQAFLDAACYFSLGILKTYGGPRRVLLTCSESLRFIIKTSIWFDVLASTTLVRTPIMLDVVRDLFSSAYSEASFDDVPILPCEEYSMMAVMGCDNHIVLALAEIAALAAWKEEHRAENRLSVPELVKRGERIGEILKKRSSDERERTLANNDRHDQSDRARQRRLTSEVFRASAHVYLHSVISGDFPQCPEIIEAVDDTVTCLKAAGSGSTGRSVVRSVVFSICIAGCLTNKVEHKHYLIERLKEQRPSGLGNCSQVEYLIDEVWRRRGTEEVDWRQVLRDAEMLLV